MVSCVTTPPSVIVFNVIVFYCCYYCSAGVIVVDVIADVIVVVCTLMGVREYMGLVLVASRATTPPLPYYQLSPHFALDLSKYDPLQKMPYQCFWTQILCV